MINKASQYSHGILQSDLRVPIQFYLFAIEFHSGARAVVEVIRVKAREREGDLLGCVHTQKILTQHG